MTYKETMKDKIKQIEGIICSYLPDEQGKQRTIFEAMNYSVLVGGKRLRPLLMGETYRLFGGDEKVIEPFMAAIEMIHSSSLVHDDLPAMDNDEYRRGKKTTWSVYGEDMGILAGDALMIYAFEVAAKGFALTKYADRVGRAISILANKTGIYGMIGGQTVDVELTGKPMDRDTLHFVHSLKTGALLQASMMIGAVLAGASEEEIDQMAQIALDIGLAFQIQDDILDVIGDAKVMGKAVNSDEKNCKTTYVTLDGLDGAKALVESYTSHAISSLRSFEVRNHFLEELLIALITREK